MEQVMWMTYQEWLAEQRFLAGITEIVLAGSPTKWTPEKEQEELYYIKHGKYPE